MHQGKLQSVILHPKNLSLCQNGPLLHMKSNNHGKNREDNFDSIIIRIGQTSLHDCQDIIFFLFHLFSDETFS